MKRIWVNGCFDILHEGHLNLLEYAASLGELYVGIDSDSRVKELKGSDRPINTQLFRWRILTSLKYVKECYIFSTNDELKNIISKTDPDIIVVGEDYRDKVVIGYSGYTTRQLLCFYPHTKGYSTTNIIENIKK
jgi:rfaE bifunctional protein nucleotidyltransferase chain/domain